MDYHRETRPSVTGGILEIPAIGRGKMPNENEKSMGRPLRLS